MGGGLPDAALPAERHLVLGPDVPVCSISPPGLPLLLPQHGPGPPHHHTALHPRQEGLCPFMCSLCNCSNLCVTPSFVTKRMCLNVACRVRRIMADACDFRSAASPPPPALRTRLRVLLCAPTAATPAARVEELQLTDRYITIHWGCLILA